MNTQNANDVTEKNGKEQQAEGLKIGPSMMALLNLGERVIYCEFCKICEENVFECPHCVGQV